jgi:nucleotide-binding universal stress UspA family protein
MDKLAHPRVVVGVDASLHGLAALRAAVAEARARRVPLHAIRSHTSLQTDEGVSMIEAAFLEALGEIPDDIEIHMTPSCEFVADALAGCATDPRDLVVVGNSGKGTLRALWSGSVPRGLIRRAHCPILAVPVPEMARTVHEHRRALVGREDLWEEFELSAPELRGRRHIDN